MKPIVAAQSDVEALVERDQWDRPKIKGPDGKIVAYPRVTTIAETIDDKFGLNNWQQNQVAKGMGRRPDLVLQAQTAGDNKQELTKVREAALDAAGSDAAANNGTTMHKLTERIDAGLPIDPALPTNVKAMLRAYQKATARFTILDVERFVVNDKIKAAGTYDRRLLDTKTGERHIGDLKTGQNINYLGLKTCQQVGIYSARSTMHYDLDGSREPVDVNPDKGILIWLPYTEDPTEALCEIHWLDLVKGRQAVKLSLAVREARSWKPRDLMPLFK